LKQQKKETNFNGMMVFLLKKSSLQLFILQFPTWGQFPEADRSFLEKPLRFILIQWLQFRAISAFGFFYLTSSAVFSCP
jgi:hypothetical protein